MKKSWFDRVEKKVNTYDRKTRAIVFRPLVSASIFLGITPNMLSHLRLLMLIPIGYFLFTYPFVGSFLILAALFTDLLDGPLARKLKMASDRGRFVDIFADNIFYSVLVFLLIFLQVANPLALTLHMVLNGIANVIVIIQRNEGIASDWLFAPRSGIGYIKVVFYCVLFLFLWFGVNVLDPVLLLLNITLFVVALYYYIKFNRSVGS